MTGLERIVRSFRTRGWRDTVLLVPERVAACLSRQGDRWFDLRHGTATRTVLELDDLDITSDNKARGIRYEPTRARPFQKLLARLQLPRNATFVDFGSGMGRVLLMAADYGFENIVGVEFSARLCGLARENIEHYAGAYGRRIAVVHGDAADYAVQPDDAVFYFFNPFDAVIMEAVRDRILASYSAAPRQIHVIYHNPVWRTVFDNCDKLEMHSEHRFRDCRFVVYRTRRN